MKKQSLLFLLFIVGVFMAFSSEFYSWAFYVGLVCISALSTYSTTMLLDDEDTSIFKNSFEDMTATNVLRILMCICHVGVIIFSHRTISICTFVITLGCVSILMLYFLSLIIRHIIE